MHEHEEDAAIYFPWIGFTITYTLNLSKATFA